MQDKRNTESVVQEIMELFNAACDASWDAGEASSSRGMRELNDKCSKRNSAMDEFESKLRELVERCSLQEPLSDNRINSMDCVYLDFEDDGSCQISSRSVREFARSIERAHNIINTNKG